MGAKLLWLALAGAAGTLSRYGLGRLVEARHTTAFPWGTLVVNGIGCFLFGIVVSTAGQRLSISAETRAVVTVGFLGAFTTFSTYLAETVPMLQDQRYGMAAANLLAQNILGIGLFLVGAFLGRHI